VMRAANWDMNESKGREPIWRINRRRRRGLGKLGKLGGEGLWALGQCIRLSQRRAGRLEKGASLSDAKYAVLHLAAGVELLLKEQLRREHWALLFSKPTMPLFRHTRQEIS